MVDTGASENFDKSQTNKAEHCEEMKRITEDDNLEYHWVN